MGKPTGFIEFSRSLPILRNAKARLADWNEFHTDLPADELKKQGARCMDCGVPFCQTGATLEGANVGCPLGNLIPEWNDLVYRGKWFEAYVSLASTNNFPEFTGRVCPAPCESSCVLGINEEPVMIKEIEVAIVDEAFEKDWVRTTHPRSRTRRKVAIIGSGPAGLACADELNKYGHNVTVFERDDRVGGLLMYGIPNMKLDKSLVQRRLNLMRDEGVDFRPGVAVGVDVSADELTKSFDAIVLACGAMEPRNLPIEGRDLKGIHFAMEFLFKNTKSLLDSEHMDGEFIDVKDKKVIVIGGGDTGTDCIGTSLRHGCKSIVQFEIMPPPPEKVYTHESWLSRARTFQVDYGQEEAKAIFGRDPREYSVMTKRFIGDENGAVKGLETVEIEWNDGIPVEKKGTERLWETDAVFLAMGFTGVEKLKLFSELGVNLTAKGRIEIDENKKTAAPKVFAAGDCERGQSLIVWAIADGRKAATSVDAFLQTQKTEIAAEAGVQI